MNKKFFRPGFAGLIANPIKAWDTIYSENREPGFLRNRVLLPVIILVSVSAVAGSLFFITSGFSKVYSIFTGIKCFTVLYITTYATAFLLGEITYPLDLGKDFSISFRLILYSLVPFFICQIISRFFESLLFINILGLYGLYIFRIGSDKLLNPPGYKKMPLLIATAAALAVIYIATNIVLNKLIDKLYYALFS